MPVLTIKSNCTTHCSSQKLQTLSQAVAQYLGKPEGFVMVSFESVEHMLFAGTDEPLAYCELKSIGLDNSQTKQLSQQLCNIIGELFTISQDRIYIEFSAPERSKFGWNASTF